MAELALGVPRQRPIFMRAGFAFGPVETAAASNQPEQPELERKAGLDRLGLGWLPGLVIDDRQPPVGEPVDAVGATVKRAK